jgi:hypothetical protein
MASRKKWWPVATTTSVVISSATEADDVTIAGIELALHSLARRLKQSRLHDYFARQAGVRLADRPLHRRHRPEPGRAEPLNL